MARSSDQIRGSDGTGIGDVAGQTIGLLVSVDVGDTGYVLDAELEQIRISFEGSFRDFELKREFKNVPQSPDGATINLILTGLSIGAGLVASEFLKEAGKSLWKSFQPLLKSESQIEYISDKGDWISLKLIIDGKEASAAIKIPSRDKTKTSEELLRQFCEKMPAKLYRELNRNKQGR